ncbi:dihydroxyacetone kinase subunit DhaL [Bosea sp. 2KB_26]|uniref:dihydroxyacetone kinase subunit DhaL n=1 Tax=Bosea sp. 2KB_26 TaxID=3237475 RepID=UPI000DE3157F
MDDALKKKLIEAMTGAIVSHTDELTALDQAIGDGDHGLNMKRGFEAVLADMGPISAKPLPDALQAIGTTLVMKVGGASGPLYGTLFMALGKELPPEPTVTDLARALAAAIEAVKARGKSDLGQKTMLDVLAPLQVALAHGGTDLTKRLPEVVKDAAEATVPLRAIRGRASFLGERSVGHMDPGARSSALLATAICNTIGA